MSTLGSSFGSGYSGGPADETGLGGAQTRPTEWGRGGAGRGFGDRPGLGDMGRGFESGDMMPSTDVEHGATEPE